MGATISDSAARAERQELIRYLRESAPEQLMAEGDAATVAAFHRAVNEVPAYRRLIIEQDRIDPAAVTDTATFRSLLPLLDKRNTFGAVPIRELCVGGNLAGVRSLLTSSGHSGVFSFGVNTEENLQRSARSIDMGLQYIFNVDELRTLLINALPIGVKVHTKATVLAETSIREDMVFALVRKFHQEFDQIIIVGEGSFAKKIIEDGRELHGIDWEDLRVHLVVGEEGIAENYRTYMGSLIGAGDFDHPESKMVISSMGVAELDLNIFHETRDTIRIRRLAHRDPCLRAELFGPEARLCPMFFIYYPHRCFVEQVATDRHATEIAVSILSPEMKLPLLRYRTGDLGRPYSYRSVVAALQRCGHDIQPDLKLPFVAVHGRGEFVGTSGGNVHPDAVKEAVYADPNLASRLTGNFRLLRQDNGAAKILFQLKERVSTAGANAQDRFGEVLAAYCDAPVEAEFLAYHGFPFAMELDYERKFRYV
jgi:phenylacetate-CoA ligase